MPDNEPSVDLAERLDRAVRSWHLASDELRDAKAEVEQLRDAHGLANRLLSATGEELARKGAEVERLRDALAEIEATTPDYATARLARQVLNAR